MTPPSTKKTTKLAQLDWRGVLTEGQDPKKRGGGGKACMREGKQYQYIYMGCWYNDIDMVTDLVIIKRLLLLAIARFHFLYSGRCVLITI